jgi:Dyp-type peroxidase family
VSAPAPLAGVETADIQGNVLHGYGGRLPFARYVPVHVPHPAAGRALLKGLAPNVTGAVQWKEPPGRALNIAVSHLGLRALGVPAVLREQFPPEFRDGMAARASRLGDAGPGAPERWNAELRAIELLVIEYAADEDQRRRGREQLECVAKEAGVRLEKAIEAELLPNSREHFGYRDGLAQPALDLAPSANDAGQGVRARFGQERPLALGEFVHGYRDEDDMFGAAPPPPFSRNGTYMVLRKLHQEVKEFDAFVKATAALVFNGDEDLTAAKIAGRWKDGTPLIDRPATSVPVPNLPASRLNDFRYGDDPRGYKCPIGAHIRRANPRDGLFDGDVRTRRHRIIRRGMPYTDGNDKGLVFVCFNASIARQFEVVNGWLRDGAPFGLGRDADVLTGNTVEGEASGKATFQGDVPVLSRVPGPFVWARGGEYLFLPSLTALDVLAHGRFGSK